MLRFPRESSESEDFVRFPLDHAHDAIHILDENGVSVFDTASRTGILGFDGDEVIGRNNYHLIHEEDRDAVIVGGRLHYTVARIPLVGCDQSTAPRIRRRLVRTR